MDKEIFEILRLLRTSERVYLSDIEKATNLKKYKINSIVQKINNNSGEFGCVIDVKRGRGYRLIMYNQEQFIDTYRNLTSIINNYSIEQQIFRFIAYSHDYTMIKQIEAELYVTRVKIQAAIDTLNKDLTSYSLQLNYTPYKGYILVGRERYVRKYLIDNLIFLEDSKPVKLNYLSGYQNKYINNVLHVQYERVSHNFILKNNNFKILNENKLLGKFDLDLNYPHIELNYIAEVLKIFDLNTGEKNPEFIKFLRASCIDRYSHIVDDPFIIVHLQNILNMCEHAHNNAYISLNIGSHLQNEISNFIAELVVDYYDWEETPMRILEFSSLIFPVVEYMVRMVVTNAMNKYFEIGILDNGNVFALQGLKEQLKIFNPTMNITVISMGDIQEIDFKKYDVVLTQHFLSEKETNIITGTKRINICPMGMPLEFDKLHSYIHTLDYVYFIRKYMKLGLEEEVVNYEPLQQNFDINIYVTPDINSSFCVDRAKNRIYVAKDLYYSNFENTAFLYSLYWRWCTNKPEWFSKKKISIGDVISELRK